VFVGAGHALVIIVYNCFICLDKNCRMFNSTGTVVLGAISAFLALLFCLFVAIMFCDQIQCIWGNTSTIDKLKRKANMEGDKKSETVLNRTGWENVKEVFGCDSFNISWFWPTDIPRELVVEREFD